MIPILPNGYSRSTTLAVTAAALPLNKLFGAKSGAPIHQDRTAIARHFNVSPTATLVLSGVGYDQHLEHYWGAARRAGFPDYLAEIKPALVTTPNFSLFSNVPRTNDQYNMKRIAICWQELSVRKIPAAIHLNARTNQDWRRWTQFMRTHPEARAVAFEFRTGAASPIRGAWYRDRLIELAQGVGRPLVLVMRGGLTYVGVLAKYFSVAFLSHTPLIRAFRRRKLVWVHGGKPTWRRCAVQNGNELDELVIHNVTQYTAMVQSLRDAGIDRN